MRSTWDYTVRPAEFLDWARSLDQSRLLNGADVFAWNHDKRYLLDLHRPARPCRPRGSPAPPSSWRPSTSSGTAVVKPAVGAGGEGLAVVGAGLDEAAAAAYVETGAVVVQPLVTSIRTHGEVSVFIVDGVPCCQVVKVPVGDEVRVHEEYGGSSTVVQPRPGLRRGGARRGRRRRPERFGRRLDYLRVDLLWWEGEWVVSELELIEPGLYLDVAPGNAAPFADLVAARSHALD